VKRLLCFSIVAVLVVAGATAFARGASAHGDREVAGMQFTVGWANEPALAGQPNAVQLFIERAGEPVEGAEESLNVTVSLGDETTDRLKLRSVFESPGEYRADLMPTVVGGYTFHFQGTVRDEDVDESFTSPEDGFDEVTGTSDIAFPAQAPTTTELAERVLDLEDEVEDAKSAAALPRTLAIVAIVLGALGLAAGLRRTRASA
jgi:hypothetical protein